MASHESVPSPTKKRPLAEVQVHSDQDNGDDFDADTYVAVDGSLRFRHTRLLEMKERGNDQVGPSEPTERPSEQPHAVKGAAPVTRDELMKIMTSFKGEIKDLINKKTTGHSSSQPRNLLLQRRINLSRTVSLLHILKQTRGTSP